jgi:hypothetical protein
MTIMADDLTAAVEELAPADRPLMVHVSLRSFGAPIAGGAETLLDVLLTRGRTVLVAAFTEPQFGLQAEELIAAQSPADVYGPIRELAARGPDYPHRSGPQPDDRDPPG